MSGDANKILRTYLLAQPSLTAIVSQRVFCPVVPEGETLPALGFFIRGGDANSSTRKIIRPSFQFDCWGTNQVGARALSTALFDILQGIGGYYDAFIPVVVGASTFYILSAKEDVQAQDMQEDVNLPNYFKVLSFFTIKMQIE